MFKAIRISESPISTINNNWKRADDVATSENQNKMGPLEHEQK